MFKDFFIPILRFLEEEVGRQIRKSIAIHIVKLPYLTYLDERYRGTKKYGFIFSFLIESCS